MPKGQIKLFKCERCERCKQCNKTMLRAGTTGRYYPAHKESTEYCSCYQQGIE